MKIHSGSNLFLIRNSYISKYFSDLTSSNLSYPFRYSLLDHDKNNLKIQLNINEIKKINRIYHFKFINSKGGCYQIPRNNDRFKFSNNLISRHICQPTILGSWDVILPFINDDTSLELRSNAIFNMAGLNHYQIMCRFNDFENLFLRTLI